MSRYHAALNRREWDKVRRAAFARDGRVCQKCGVSGGVFEVDHVKPLHLGGAALDLANAQILCRDCHFRKSAGERARPDPERDAWRRRLAERAG